MKTLARILVILAAALAVVGVTVAVAPGGSAQSPAAGEREGRRLGVEAADGPGIFEPGEPVAGLRAGRGLGQFRNESEVHAGREGGRPAGSVWSGISLSSLAWRWRSRRYRLSSTGCGGGGPPRLRQRNPM